MRKRIYTGIEDAQYPNKDLSFLSNPEIADLYKNEYPNEAEILLEGFDKTEWCSWEFAQTHWSGYLAGFKAGRE